MKMKNGILKVLSAVLLASTLLTGLVSCSEKADSDTKTTASAVQSMQNPSGNEDLQPDASLPIRFAVLSGSTGYGAAKLKDDTDKKNAALNYQITAESSVKVVQDGLIAGTLDLAALPTNKAAMIANATDGKIQVVAVNTLGVMYLVTTDGTKISSLNDLKGKSVGIPEEPSYILKALCEKAGLNTESDLTINTFATPGDLVAAVIKGEVTTAVLPEPLLSTAMAKKSTIEISMNLTEEWEKTYTDGKLMQGCIVVRTEWAEQHPAELAKFMEEYKASVSYVKANPEQIAPVISAWFGTAEAVAAKAITRCNLTYMDGAEMKEQLQKLYNVLVTISTSGIGGKVPTDDFYYLPKA